MKDCGGPIDEPGVTRSDMCAALKIINSDAYHFRLHSYPPSFVLC
jgi:hypothetical protein